MKSKHIISYLFCLLALSGAAGAQEYQLKKGTRIPGDRVKLTGDTYTAILSTPGGTPETVTFTVKDIAQVSMPEPPEFQKARDLIADGRGVEAAEAIKPALEKTKPLLTVPGSLWPEAIMIQLDAMSVAGRPAGDLVDDATINKLPPADRDAVGDMVKIAASSKDAKEDTLKSIKNIATKSADSWVTARAWLQVGNIYSNQGKIEDAVKAWLRVPVFSGAEKDMALRGTVYAARGMQLLNCANDGIQILDDYMADYPLSSSHVKDLVESEKKKLAPKEKPSA